MLSNDINYLYMVLIYIFHGVFIRLAVHSGKSSAPSLKINLLALRCGVLSIFCAYETLICLWRSDNYFSDCTLSEFQIETANGPHSLALTQAVRYQTVTFAPAVTLAPQVQHCYMHCYSYRCQPSAY